MNNIISFTDDLNCDNSLFKSLGDDYVINTPRFGIFKEQAPLTEAQNDENTGELMGCLRIQIKLIYQND